MKTSLALILILSAALVEATSLEDFILEDDKGNFSSFDCNDYQFWHAAEMWWIINFGVQQKCGEVQHS